MKNNQRLLSVLLPLFLSSLSACTLKASEPVPAILPVDSSEARAEVITIVSNALGGQNIPIAADVFQESSRLLLGAKPMTSSNGVTIYGANKAPALVFELIKQDGNCLIRRLDTMETWSLKTTLCMER